MERLELVHCELEPGGAIFFHCNLLHCSAQNTSANPRWALICCYNAARNNPYKESRHPRYSLAGKMARFADRGDRPPAPRRLRLSRHVEHAAHSKWEGPRLLARRALGLWADKQTKASTRSFAAAVERQLASQKPCPALRQGQTQTDAAGRRVRIPAAAKRAEDRTAIGRWHPRSTVLHLQHQPLAFGPHPQPDATVLRARLYLQALSIRLPSTCCTSFSRSRSRRRHRGHSPQPIPSRRPGSVPANRRAPVPAVPPP